MPADRLLHPRAGKSHKVSMLTDLEYRVWTQYLLSSDDFGVMHATTHAIQNDNLHLALRPAKLIKRCLEALISAGLVHRFEHQGQPYVFQTDWQRWQKVEYPRATINPCPSGTDLEACDDATRDLFTKHPGGQRKTVRPKDAPSDSERTSQMHTEDVPSMRAGPPAKRLTANGLRLEANGERLDVAFRSFQSAYPPQRRKGGILLEQAFVTQAARAGGPSALMAALENHKASGQWQDPKLVPGMDTWLNEERWRQQLEPPTAKVDPRRPSWAV